MKTRAWIGAAGAALFAAPLALAQPQLEPPRPAPAPTPSVAPAPTPPPAATPTTTDAAPDATPAATPPTTPPPPPSGEPRAPRADPFWQTRYEEAKTKLLVGEFAEAAEMLKSLEETAPTESDRRLAREQRALALEWANRGLVFVKRSDLGESTLSPKALDRRTTDELAQLYTSAFFYGVGTGGWIAALTKPSSVAGVVLPMLLLSGASIGGVVLLDSGRGLRYGVPQAIVSGMNIGAAGGGMFALYGASRSSGEWSPEATATTIWAPATIGAITGGIVASEVGSTPGQASWVGSAAIWSGFVGGMLAGTAVERERDNANAFLAAGVAVNAGIVAGVLSAGPVSPSIARVRFIDLGGFAGTLTFGGLYFAIADKDSNARAGAGMAALGATAGLTTALLLTSGMPDDRRDDKKPETVSFQPIVAPTGGGATMGLGGTF